MRSSSRRSQLSKKRSNHHRSLKSFPPPVPGAFDRCSRRRSDDKKPSEYNTHNPFDPDIPLHDVTGQPRSLPHTLVRCPTGGLIRAHIMYPTADEFTKMHAVKPANRFGRASSVDCSDVASLVEQLKAGGLDPEDEILLKHLNQLDMEGQFREYYHNAAEACERAQILHPIHLKMVRYRRTMEGEYPSLSMMDYQQLKRELEERRQEEERLKAEAEAWLRAEEERIQAEREAQRRAEEARIQAEHEARQREEARLCAEEEARQEEARRQEAERRRQQELEEEHRLIEEELTRLKAIRQREEEERWHQEWLAQQELLEQQRAEELRRQHEELERANRYYNLTRMWAEERQRAAREREAAREQREYVEAYERGRMYEEQKRRAAAEEAHARYKAEAVASYEDLWKRLAIRDIDDRALTYSNFPLPIFDNALKPRPNAITREAVADFVFSPLRMDARLKTRKQRIKEECRRWHPDKFETLVIPKVNEVDVEVVRSAASNIMTILTAMNAEEV